MSNIYIILPNGFDPDLRTFKEAKYLVSKNHKVTIVCWDRDNKYKDRENEVVEGIEIKRFYPKSEYGTGFKQIIPLVKFIFECKKYFKKVKENYYCHCADLEGMITGFLCCYGKRCKLVFDMREYYETGVWAKIKRVSKFLVRFFQDKCYKVIYLNDLQKSIVRQRNMKKLVYLPNYPEKQKFINTNKTKNDKIRVSYIGYVRHEKQLLGLMEAAHQFNNIYVYIYGSGVLYNKMLEYSKEYENCSVMGQFDHNYVVGIYNKTDLLFCVYDIKDINDKNAYPTKFFEGIVTKTPILVADNSVVADFCNQHNIGFAVSTDYKESLIKIFKQISEDKSILEKMAKNEEVMSKEYLWENVVGNLDNIYQ
ncbi:glycosyltransferase [Clostridium uliginosum]|uniref:Glycosyl transferases group 1 n=1 Tax=Clostridium uliginosum TaxID=119641 RepID=A0A1I1QWL9_9CLOT|nr:glycosyltransferase [Clostridium uliginosum]SFD26479.1 Glycosyl transferases group 1 [Clostridium uliginosum]